MTLWEVGDKMTVVKSMFAWIACEHPERPPDETTGFHMHPQCDACDIAREMYNRTLAGGDGARKILGFGET